MMRGNCTWCGKEATMANKLEYNQGGIGSNFTPKISYFCSGICIYRYAKKKFAFAGKE